MSKRLLTAFRESLSLKMIFAFIVVIVAVLSAFTLFAVLHESKEAKQGLREQGEMLSRLLARGAMTGVFAENRKMLESAAEGARGLKNVVSVSIYNAALKLLYSSVKTHVGTDALSIREHDVHALGTALDVSVAETDRNFEFLRPVTIRSAPAADESLYFGRTDEGASEKAIGYVRIVLSKDSYHKEIVSLLWRNAVIMLVFILSSIAIIFLTIKKVTRPLINLTHGVKALEKGQHVEPIAVETDDEVGNLAAAFNAMVVARGQAEHALRQSEQRFRLIAETIKEVFWIADIETTKTVYISPEYERVWGRSLESLYESPRSFLDAVHEEDRDRVLNALEGKKLGQLYEVEYRIIRPDGSLRLIWDRGYPVRDDGRTVCYVGVAQDITEHRGMEEKIRTYQKELRSAALELSAIESRVEERERHLIAADLHDFVGQNLFAMQLQLAALSSKMPPSADITGRVKEIRELIGQAIQYTRSLTVELSPPILDQIGLTAAVESLAEGFRKTHRIPISVEDDGRPKQLDDDARYLLFRSVRELLMNVVKHAGADRVKVFLLNDNGGMKVIVEDNGRGCDVSKVAENGKGFGLFAIRQRLKGLGGRCELESSPGSGMKVTLTAPLKQ